MEEPKEISPWAAALMTAGGNILANNRPNVSYGNAIGSGVASFAPAYYATKGAQDRQKYIDTLQKYKQLEFDAEQSKAQQEAAQKQKFQSAIESGDAFQGMPQEQVSTINRAYQIGGADLARKVFEEYSTREPKAPTPFELYLQGDPRATQWKQMGVPRSSTTVNVAGPKYGTIPPGFRLIEQGDTAYMEAVPGSPPDIESKQLEEKSKGREAQKTATSNIVIQEIDRALDKIEGSKLPVTGAGGAVLSNIAGTDAYDLGQLTETIKANTAFDRLDQMRQNSPTGGALGAVSDAERTALAATKGSLDIKQSEPQLIENLKRLRVQTDNYINGTPEQRRALGAGTSPQSQPTQAKRYVFDPESGELVPK